MHKKSLSYYYDIVNKRFELTHALVAFPWRAPPLCYTFPLMTRGFSTSEDENMSPAEQRFRLVVEAAPNAMVMVDRAGEIVMVNAQAERVFGYSRTELLGQPVEMLVPQRFRGHHPGLREAFFADPLARPMGAGRDLFGLRKDGSEFPVEIGLNPIETEEGTMVLSAIVDITERKTAEAALRESQSRLQELHAELLHVSRLSAMGQMAAMVAHELNQPLTAISNYMEAVGCAPRPRRSTSRSREFGTRSVAPANRRSEPDRSSISCAGLSHAATARSGSRR